MKHVSRVAVITLKKGDVLSAQGSGVAGSEGVLEPARHKPSEMPRSPWRAAFAQDSKQRLVIGSFLIVFLPVPRTHPPAPAAHLLLTPACSSRVKSEITSLKHRS